MENPRYEFISYTKGVNFDVEKKIKGLSGLYLALELTTLKKRYMFVTVGPSTFPAVFAASRAALEVRQPEPALHAPVLGLGQISGSVTAQTLSFHQPP